MKVAEAIKTASGRVQINCYAPHTYEVLVWSPKHNAWWQGQVQRRERALHDAWEAKVRTALELLDVEDAGAIANSAVYNLYPADWRSVVRTEAKIAHRQGELQ